MIHEPSGVIYAMKVRNHQYQKKISISTDETQLKMISEELKFMLDCESPYVVKCYGAFFKVFITFIEARSITHHYGVHGCRINI